MDRPVLSMPARSRTLRAAAGAVLLLAVVACRAVPIPIDVDLLPHLGDLASGSQTVAVPPGDVPDRTPLRYPAAEGACVEIDDLPVRLEHATIDYDVRVDYDGPPLEGTVTGQLYVAPGGAEVWSGTYVLGEPVVVGLADGSGRLSGSVRANAAQVSALNDGTICWGLELTGGGIASPVGGPATIAYAVETLRLRGGVSVF